MDNKKKISANILPVVKNGLCTGCGTCVSMCPHDAIRIEKNAKKGVYVPIINNDMCKNCGVCLQVCPKYCENHEQFWQVNFKENPEDIIVE
jgi:coenzyme F420 hydrogenase subunit beta